MFVVISRLLAIPSVNALATSGTTARRTRFLNVTLSGGTQPLTLTASSSNQTLIQNLAIGVQPITASNRPLRGVALTNTNGATGSCTVFLRVTDARGVSSDFNLSVAVNREFQPDIIETQAFSVCSVLSFFFLFLCLYSPSCLDKPDWARAERH